MKQKTHPTAISDLHSLERNPTRGEDRRNNTTRGKGGKYIIFSKIGAPMTSEQSDRKRQVRMGARSWQDESVINARRKPRPDRDAVRKKKNKAKIADFTGER